MFRDRARFELRPLTLLYGRNQAGKSTLLRLVPALADAIFGGTPVFDIASSALMGASFKELGWLGPEPSGSPMIRLETPKPHSHIEIQLTEDRGIVPNRILIGSGNNDYADIRWNGNFTRTPSEFRAPYAGKMGSSEDWDGDIEFKSMFPAGGLAAPAMRKIAAIRGAFGMLERVQWLAASRPGLSEALRPSRCCRPDGLDLPNLLADKKSVIDFASDWLSDTKILGESVAVGRDAAGSYRFELRRAGNESLPNHLSGEGAQWLLPILLCACWAELSQEKGPTMLAIEEMEARLHPNLQLALLDRLLKTVAAGVPCILETHSIYVLRRAQLAIVNGELSPQDLAIYWVERDGNAAQVREIEVLADGTLKGWNPETFEEEQQLSRQIFEARWKA